MANIAKRARGWLRGDESGSRMHISRNQGGNWLSSYPASPASYFGPLSNFFSDIDKMLSNSFNDMFPMRGFGMPAMMGMPAMGMMGMQMFQPKVDIASSENEYTITVEVPGLEENDIKLDISNDGMLTISGEKRQENTENRRDIYFSECSYGTFERTLSLPDDVDPQQVEARFKNGVLTITCPHTESSKQEQRRQIPISAEGKAEGRGSERGAEGGGTRGGGSASGGGGSHERGGSPSQGPKKAA